MSVGNFCFLEYTLKRPLPVSRGALPFRLSLGDAQDDLAACVARLTELVGPPGIRKRLDGFDHGFQFPGI